MSWSKGGRPSPNSTSATQQPPMPGVGQMQQPQWPMQQQQQQHPPNVNYPQQQQQSLPPTQQQQYWQPAQQQQNFYNNTPSGQQQNYPPQQQNYASNEFFQYNQQQFPAQQGYQNYQQQPPNNYQQGNNGQQQSWEAKTQETTSGDAWDWGWQDDGTAAQQQSNAQQQTVAQTNANIIENSFSNTGDSWNWSLEEQQIQAGEHQREATPASKESSHDTVINRNTTSHSASPRPQQQNAVAETNQQVFVQNDRKNPVPSIDSSNKNVSNTFDNSTPNIPHLPISEPNIKTLNDRGALLEHNNSLPNMAITRNRRYLNETLTPQWSTESQPSQDSSDGLLTESTTNRSEDPSTKSSPSFSQDNTNFNYPQNVDNIADRAWEDNRPFENVHANNIPPSDGANQQLVEGFRGISLNRNTASPAQPNSTENSLPPPHIPSTDRSSPNVPLLPPSNTKPQLPPSFPSVPPQSTAGSNPFKRTGHLSHKTASTIVTQPSMTENVPSQTIEQSFNQQDPHPPVPLVQSIRQPSPGLQSVPLSSPRIVQQHQNYTTANLETTPDNSERPDIPTPVNFRPMQYPQQTVPPAVSMQQNAVENFEVAPSNDRNEYMQTGHLSDVSFDNTNFTDDNLTMRGGSVSQDSFPPPGLRRMVLGQPESEFNQSSNDEPPPGLSRMVPGQLNDSTNIYAQPNDNYLDRQVDGQTTESESLNSSYINRSPNVYNRVGDGQPTDDESNYNSNQSRSSADRRPIGLDRMVPGESSTNFQGFQNQNFPSDTRVVTGYDQNVTQEQRDQNMDGSDYSELPTVNQVRSIVGVETVDNRNTGQDSVVVHPAVNEGEMIQREVNMEGENLQDLSVVSSGDFSLIRDQNMDGADVQDESITRPINVVDSGSDRQGQSQQIKKDSTKAEGDRKYHDDTTGDESDRDRYNRRSSKKDKDRMRMSREREGRYSGDRREDKKERDRRGGDSSGRVDRDRDDDRSYRRGNRDARYETEDTDYYSDRDRRRYREGSYTSSSKPPRPDRRGEDDRRSYDRSVRDERDNRKHTGYKETNSNYESERDGYSATGSRKKPDKERGFEDRDSRRYDKKDRDRGYDSLRKSKAREDRKRDSRYPPRPNSRDPEPAEEDDPNNETGGSLDRRGHTRHSVDRDGRSHKRDRRDRERDREYNQQYYDPRYGGYGMDPYSQQMYQHHQQTYQYYEKLRQTNPQAYMEIYSKYMTGQHRPYGDAYSGLPGYDQSSSSRLADERGSVHSGQSSTNGEGLKDRMLLDTSFGGGSNIGINSSNYFYPIRNASGSYRQGALSGHRRMGSGSVRTDISDSRDYNTDSIQFGLENSTVKSERMTPVKFATAHIKGVISSTNLVTVTPSYPMDGQPAIVEILDLNKILVNDSMRCELNTYPGPLIKGTTHKKTIIEYCELKIREAMDRNSYVDRSGGNYYSKPHHLPLNSGNSNSVSERQTISSISHLHSSADIASYVLMWELLILLLRQNGMVVGTDIAELLVKNKRQFDWQGSNSAFPTGVRNLSRRGSNSSVTSRSAEMPIEEVMPGEDNTGNLEGEDSSNDAGSLTNKQRTSSQQQIANKVSSANNVSGGNTVRRASSNANILESPAQEKYVTDKFREYLLFGNGKEALEWAMTHGLWGHALFLASKLDKRTYANVMMRFANGLAANDPLQTLYQLMSGRQPASVTCVLDEKWGDWRPHLAMILSNTTQRPELDRKSITSLGDTLLSRGDVYAAHFCYLMSREEPSSSPGSRLQLLGLPPASSAGGHGGPAAAACTNPYKAPSHNIIMTEIYEYACSLNQTQRAMGHFQFYKFLLATRFVDCGLYERALLYLETISGAVAQEPQQYQAPFLQRVLDLADRLKYFDPEENVGDLSLEDQQDNSVLYSGSPLESMSPSHAGAIRSPGDKQWLTSLRDIVAQAASDLTSHTPYSATQFDHQQHSYHQQQMSTNAMSNDWSSSTSQQHSIQQHNSGYDPLQMQQQEVYERQQHQQNLQYGQQHNSQFDPQHNSEGATENATNFTPQLYDPNSLQHAQSNYLTPLSYGQQDSRDDAGLDRDSADYTTQSQVPSDGGASSYWNQDQQYGYHENREPLDAPDLSRPQISMPNSALKKSQYDDSDQDNDNDKASQQKISAQDQQHKNQKASKEKKDLVPAKPHATSGWFGGIFNKLSLKPKNQMILPDDKNPSIVWDSEKKKWVNLDSDEQEQEAHFAPPPKMSDIVKPIPANFNNNIPPPVASMTPEALMMSSGSQNTSTPVPPPNMPNIFKLQKSRHIKKAYVDVFNPSGAPMKPLAPASEVLGDPMMMSSQPQTAPTSYFVPGPGAHTTDQGNGPSFYNPADY